jgi:carbon monoxide dehydrogenase subunit G
LTGGQRIPDVKLDGRAQIRATRPAVWTLILDPERVAACLPGVESIHRLDETRFKVNARVNLGFFAVGVGVDVEYAEVHEPDDVTVRARGHAAGGGVDVKAVLLLTDAAEGGTDVHWTADVTISGALASLGEGRVAEEATNSIGRTLACIKKRLEA